jgi:nucleoid-associated protein YgaU
MGIVPDLHAPAVLRFYWDSNVFTGVMETLNVTYTLFDAKGVPMRAKASVALKQYAPVSVQVRETPRNSPDVDKAYVVQAGDTLSGIAGAAYGDPGLWREIALANGILDPRRLDVGRALRIPKLRGTSP